MNTRDWAIWRIGAAVVAAGCANVVDKAPTGTDTVGNSGPALTSGPSSTSSSAGPTSVNGTANSSSPAASASSSSSTADSTGSGTSGNTGGGAAVTSTSGDTNASVGAGGTAASTSTETAATGTNSAGGATSTDSATSGGGITGDTTTTMTSTTSTSGGDPDACLFEWREQPEAAPCVDATQGDHQECEEFLDCYLENECSPSTCSTAPMQPCYEGELGVGSGGKGIATQVFEALCTG